MPSDLRSLVSQATQGDGAALEELLERNLKALRAYVRLRAGGVIEAKESVSDVVQSVCREVLEDLPSFEYRGEESFRAWLFQQAWHKIADRGRFYRAAKRDEAREQSPQSCEELESIAASLHTPSRDAIAREELGRLEEALQELPEEQRVAILLQRVARLPYSEIAAQMGKSEGAVRNYVYRGLARVALRLGKD